MENRELQMVFITYGDEKFEKSKKYALKMALKKGRFDKAIGYGREDIDEDFLKEHSEILAIGRGGGMWLWKPYILLKALQQQEDGDIVFYSDAGAYFIKDCRIILSSMKDEDIWVSHGGKLEKQYTRAAAFDLMDCKGEKYKDAYQAAGTFVGVRKTPRAIRFIEEWLRYCCDPRILLDKHPIDEAYTEDEAFIAHREDQSVLSLLRTKWGIVAHKTPAQHKRVITNPAYHKVLMDHADKYPPVIIHHRSRHNRLSLLTRINCRLIVIMPWKWMPYYLKLENWGRQCGQLLQKGVSKVKGWLKARFPWLATAKQSLSHK